MNLHKPLAFHYYSYRRFYLLFWFPIIFLNGLFLYLKLEYYFQSTIFLVFFNLFFSYSLGSYEYQKLMPNYLFLKPGKIPFFYSSLIFSGVNALIQTSCLIILYFGFSIPIENIFFFPFVFFASIFAFVFAAFLTLLLNLSKKIQIFIELILLGGFAYLFKGRMNEVFDYLREFLYNKDFLLKSIPILIASSGILFGLIYLKFKLIKK